MEIERSLSFRKSAIALCAAELPEPGKWSVVALPEASQRLDRHRDNLFR
ncbi:hypothetical protein [Nocardia acidivorans]|nr:hypothetical protein [Nocardia acidivorans]